MASLNSFFLQRGSFAKIRLAVGWIHAERHIALLYAFREVFELQVALGEIAVNGDDAGFLKLTNFLFGDAGTVDGKLGVPQSFLYFSLAFTKSCDLNNVLPIFFKSVVISTTFDLSVRSWSQSSGQLLYLSPVPSSMAVPSSCPG